MYLDGSSSECNSNFSAIGIIVINSGNSTNRCDTSKNNVEVRVPIGSPVTLDGSFGNILIGDTNADVSLDISGSSTITIGNVRNIFMDKSGSGSMYVNSVVGYLNLNISGSGDLTVKSGEITSITMNKSGSGNTYITATIGGNVSIDKSGSGNTYINCVRGFVHNDTSGSGSSDIRACQ